MMRARVVLLALSLVAVVAFSGLLMAGRGSEEEEVFKTLGTLSEVVHLVLTEYVDELNQEALSLSLDSSFVESLDPNAAVLPAEAVVGFQRVVEVPPAYGLVLGLRLGSAAVKHTVPGSPAEDLLDAWEVIERVEGVNTRGRPLWQIRVALAERFVAGEPVHLTVVDRSVDERREVELGATPWEPEVVTREVRDGVEVVRVLSLPRGAAASVREVVAGDRPVLLDLRDLVWGDEEEAVRVADLFVASGTLGVWRGRRVGEKAFPADPEAVTPSAPVVLVGNGTEGSGEILAAALQRAGSTLVGQTTAGRASHMRLVQDHDLSLWLPVAHWLRPDDTPIHRQGVEPGEVVEGDAEDEDADPVLDRGLELARVPLEQAA